MVKVKVLKPLSIRVLGAKVNLKVDMTWNFKAAKAAELVKNKQVEIINVKPVEKKIEPKNDSKK